MLLELDRVAKFYGNKLIFKEISLQLTPGSVLLVLGRNGAGKSTLLRLMAGLEQPSVGQVKTADDLRLGYLGHRTFVYPQLSAVENLRFWARLHGQDASEALLIEALERMELKASAHERAGCFSRGMAQRLSLARVFLMEPTLLLLDEPGTGLDRRSSGILEREIEHARARGAGLVWVTHDVERDLSKADLALALDGRGRAWYGPTADFIPEAVA